MQTHEFKLKQLRTLGIILTCGALAVGCAGKGVKPVAPESDPIAAAPVSQNEVKPVEEKASEPAPVNVEVAANQSEVTPIIDDTMKAVDESTEIRQPAQLTFYFGFDKTELNEADKAILREHARFLKANPSLILQVNGHTDHHGPREYNTHLSKQRAEAVAKVLLAEGITRSQMVINALADDKPLAAQGGSKKNRRVELEYNELNLVSNH